MRLLANSALALFLATAIAPAGEINDIEFSKPGGVSLTLDAYVPEGKGPFPTVIIVHGGGWINGTKRSYVTPIFPVLTKAGFAWFTINYRLAPQYKFPAATEDVDAAIRWVRAHAKEYKVDTRRIALLGESAGGHLVAYAAIKRNKGAEVSAVVDFYGAHDLLKREKERGEVTKNLREFLGVDKLDDAGIAKLREASPITYVKKDSPRSSSSTAPKTPPSLTINPRSSAKPSKSTATNAKSTPLKEPPTVSAPGKRTPNSKATKPK